jgi:hypothetical protein
MECGKVLLVLISSTLYYAVELKFYILIFILFLVKGSYE